MKILILFLGLVVGTLAQVSNTIVPVASDPTGATCSTTSILLLTPNGTIFTCQNGTYASAGGGGGSSVCMQASGSSTPGCGGTINFTTDGTLVVSGSNVAGVPTDQFNVNTAKITSNTALQANTPLLVTNTSASGTTYTGTMSPTLTAYSTGMIAWWQVGATACTPGAITLNIDALGAIPIKVAQGNANPTTADCVALTTVPLQYDGTVWRIQRSKPGGFQVSYRGTDATTAGTTLYITIPYGCVMTDYTITADSTATIKLWRVADGGTALPTVSNTLSTSGFSLSSGTRLHSTTLTDLSSKIFSAYDTIGVNLFATGSTHVEFELGCSR